MKVLRVRHIDGPNVYIYKPILVARVDLEEYTEKESYEFPSFSDRLLRTLPGLREHHCAKGQPGGFVERLYSGTYFGHIVEHVCIEMACLLGLDVHYGKTIYAGSLGSYDIIMECKSFATQRALLYKAIEVVTMLSKGESPDVASFIADVKRETRHLLLGPSTQAIVDAAFERGIPVRRLTDRSLVQLGYGRARKLVAATITSGTSALGVDASCDKALTKQLLLDAGIPVPEGGVCNSFEEAVQVFERIGPPVVLKPIDGNQGRGVTLKIETQDELSSAHRIASQISNQVIVERFIQGRHLRILVINGEYVAASQRIPPQVVGDGVHSVSDLIDITNQDPKRGIGHEKPLTQIVVDEIVRATLSRQNYTLLDVPEQGAVVLLRESANLSTGGEAIDVTDALHHSYRRLAERIARVMDLDVCGIDMVISSELMAPFSRDEAAVIEVNSAPGIRMHEHPSHGLPRRVGRKIVDMLFPPGCDGRIPIVSITGTNGKTTTTRLIGHTIAAHGQRVGMTTTGGVTINGETILEGDTTGPESARMVLSDPSVDVAVLETARGGIVRGGLAYDKANVAVMTNLSADHVGQDGVDSIEHLLHVKSLVAECVFDDGTVVLNADNPHLAALGRRLRPRVVYFAMSEENPTLMRHLACGGVGYFVARSWIVEARGHLTWEVARTRDIPITMDGTVAFHVENCLAATAALRALGFTRQQVAHGLASFHPTRNNSGRLMIYELPHEVRVVLDYGHNADGFEKVGEWLQKCPHERLIGVVGVPGDRADSVIRSACAKLSRYMDTFVVKEDVDKRGRAVGEVAQLMANELHREAPEKPISMVLDEREALRQAINAAKPGDIVVAFYEKLSPLQSLVTELGGMPTTTMGFADKEEIFAAMS